MLRLRLVRALLLPRLPLSRTGVYISMAVISLLQLLFILYTRRVGEVEPASLAILTSFNFDPYMLGLAVGELAIPMALLFLMSGTALFKRVVMGFASNRDKAYLFLVLSLIQILFFAYIYGLSAIEIGQVTRGFLLVMIAGFLGGWPVGFGLGLVTWFLLGTSALIHWPPEDFYWRDVLYWWYIRNEEASPVVWVGMFAGLTSQLLQARRFVPVIAMVSGIGLEAVARYFVALLESDPSYWIDSFIASVLITGLAMLVFALLVRNVQANINQQQAQIAELALSQAELRSLRAQINPHFLYNSLNTIRYFVRTEPDTARQLLLNLSEVFQRALSSGDFVVLGDELSYVDAYLALEKARLGDRLTITKSIDEALLTHLVPTLILQPLIENAVIHGLAKKPTGGELMVSIERWGEHMVLQVRDNGMGMVNNVSLEMAKAHTERTVAAKTKTSIGLSNIAHRLSILYGKGEWLIIESEPDKGTRVQLKIPLSP